MSAPAQTLVAFPGGTYDADVVAWIVAVTAAGGTVGGPQTGYIQTLVTAFKSAGVWAVLDRCWVFAAENTQQATIDLKARAVATPVLAPTFTANRGYAGNGTTQWIDHNFIPSTAGGNLTQNSTSIFGYDRTTRSAANFSMLGTRNLATTAYELLTPNASSSTTIYRVSANTGPSVTVSQTQGFWHGNRDGATTEQLYLNGSQVDNQSVTSTGLPDQSMFSLGFNNGAGVGVFLSTDQIALVGWGGSLNSTQAAALYTAVQAYMTSVGANV